MAKRAGPIWACPLNIARRIAELREGRRTECVVQHARDQRSRFTFYLVDMNYNRSGCLRSICSKS